MLSKHKHLKYYLKILILWSRKASLANQKLTLLKYTKAELMKGLKKVINSKMFTAAFPKSGQIFPLGAVLAICEVKISKGQNWGQFINLWRWTDTRYSWVADEKKVSGGYFIFKLSKLGDLKK